MSKLKAYLKRLKILVALKHQAIIAYNLLQEKRRKEVYNVKVQEISSPDHKNFFCGYYDISPFNKNDSNIIIAHANNADPKKDPSADNSCDLGYYDIASKKFVVVDTTNCWNWQQGSRLQWIDENRFVYNFFNKQENRLSSKLHNFVTSEVEILPFPISTAYKSEFILTLSYSRLTDYSEYGYHGIISDDAHKGVEQYSLSTKQLLSLFTFEDIRSLLNLTEVSKAHINHLLVRPDGKKFVFIFRYYKKQARYDTLLSYDFETGKIRVLIKNQIISHFTWKNDIELLVWGIFGNGPGYYLVNCEKGTMSLIHGDKNDGHPTYLSDKSIITDSYPNSLTKQHYLTILSKDLSSRSDLLKLNHPIIYSTTCRCDMHPSVSHDEKFFQVDTRHLNNRSVLIGELRH
jgi:hypothetical protein